jgi:hypothetical protein
MAEASNANALLNELSGELQSLIEGSLLSAISDQNPQSTALQSLKVQLEKAKAKTDKAKAALESEMETLHPKHDVWLNSMISAAKTERRAALLRKHSQRQVREFALDVVRIGLVALAGCLAWQSLFQNDNRAGLAAVGIADGYILLLLFIAALRSNTTYNVSSRFSDVFYFLFMPSRFAALLIVPGLFMAVWFGFAGLYVNSGILLGNLDMLDTPREALMFSLGGFASYGEGDLLTPLAEYLAIAQFTSGILILVCIFALLVNRLSDW